MGDDLSLGHGGQRESSIRLNWSPACNSTFPAVVSGNDVFWWISSGTTAGCLLLETRRISK